MASPRSDLADRVSFPLLENGLDFLVAAVEHLHENPGRRDLKYAVLHLASGIELVLKERLRQHNPAQLYQQPEQYDAADFEAGDFQSTSAKETVKRLVDVAGVTISDAERTQLHRLRGQRNRAEHFGFDESGEAVLAITAVVLGFALDFIAKELAAGSLSPAAASDLRRIRETLPGLRTFVADRWRRIAGEVHGASTAVVRCAHCGEEAAVISGGVSCRFCGYSATATEGADEYAHSVVGASHYEYVHDGASWVVSMCPDCERETLVDQGRSTGDAQSGRRWVCFGCGLEWSDAELWSCDICGAWIPGGYGEMTVCGDCFEYRVGSSD